MPRLRLEIFLIICDPRRRAAVLGIVATLLMALAALTLPGCRTLRAEAVAGDVVHCHHKVAAPFEVRCWKNNEEPHYIWSGPMRLDLQGVCRPCPDGTCPKCPDGTETQP